MIARRAGALACSAGLLVAGCGDGDGSAATATAKQSGSAAAGPAERAVRIDISSFRFFPKAVTVATGGTVTWTNRDKAPHSAENGGIDGPARFDTGRLELGDSKGIPLATPGVYTYYCVYHRFMEATLTVR